MINKSIIMGRLTADPELRQTPSGVSNCSITVAVDRDYVPQGQERQADFISVVAWRQTAEFISKYFSKGKMIAVEGQLRTRSYEDKRYPDVRHYVMELYADKVSFCGDRSVSSPQNTPNSKPDTNNIPAATFADLANFEEITGNEALPF